MQAEKSKLICGSIALFVVCLILTLPCIAGQSAGNDDLAKAKAQIDAAIQALGGQTYLNVRSQVTSGLYSRFDRGASTVPSSFVDYVIYPDKDRTDFGSGKMKDVQSNSGSTGWIYEGASKAIKDQTPEQIKATQENLKYGLDGVLRGSWREAGVKVTFFDRREAWPRQFGRAVKLEYPDSNVVTIYFDMKDSRPLSLVREHTVKDELIKEETRYNRWAEWQGVLVPTFVDTYANGVQTGRISFDNISFNQNVPASLFAKPSSPKEVK